MSPCAGDDGAGPTRRRPHRGLADGEAAAKLEQVAARQRERPRLVHFLAVDAQHVAAVDGVVDQLLARDASDHVVPNLAVNSASFSAGGLSSLARERRLVRDRVVVRVDQLALGDQGRRDRARTPTIAMERARRIDLTRALTPSVTACGLMKTNAWCFENFGVSSNGSPPTFCAILSIGPMSMSSKVSKSDCDAPSTSTCGSFVHESSVGLLDAGRHQRERRLVLVDRAAEPVEALRQPLERRRRAVHAVVADVGLRREAELLPPRVQSARASSPDCAFSGSVAPSTDARNSAHESAAGPSAIAA